jgi:hypothetical protein
MHVYVSAMNRRLQKGYGSCKSPKSEQHVHRARAQHPLLGYVWWSVKHEANVFWQGDDGE